MNENGFCVYCGLYEVEEDVEGAFEDTWLKLEEIGVPRPPEWFIQESKKNLESLCQWCLRFYICINLLLISEDVEMDNPTFYQVVWKLQDVVIGRTRELSKRAVIEEVKEHWSELDRKGRLFANHLLMRLHLGNKSLHISEEEKELIRKFKEAFKFSIGELAYVFDRSKSSIHQALQ